jgi:hypothetical protein
VHAGAWVLGKQLAWLTCLQPLKSGWVWRAVGSLSRCVSYQWSFPSAPTPQYTHAHPTCMLIPCCMLSAGQLHSRCHAAFHAARSPAAAPTCHCATAVNSKIAAMHRQGRLCTIRMHAYIAALHGGSPRLSVHTILHAHCSKSLHSLGVAQVHLCPAAHASYLRALFNVHIVPTSSSTTSSLADQWSGGNWQLHSTP